MLDVEPELVAVPDLEPEEAEEEAGFDDELPDEARELEEAVIVDLRDPVPTTVTLAREPVLSEPVGFMTGVTKVEFWPAGTTAAEAWEVAAAG